MKSSLLNGSKTCQVCNKSFPNAMALRGHMMSHTKKRSAPNAESASGSTLPSLETSKKVGANFKPHETVLIRSNHTSEKRKGKRVINVDEEDSPCSHSSLTAVEEAGLILVAMSTGQRPENSQNWNAIDRLLKGKEKYNETDSDSDDNDNDKEVKYKSVAELLTSNVETLSYNNEDEDTDTDTDADDETYLVEREKKCKKKFRCDDCGKVLGSYQALGGHRSSNSCKRLKIGDKKDQDRRYMCDYCGKVFDSGQALGGHKKSHYI